MSQSDLPPAGMSDADYLRLLGLDQAPAALPTDTQAYQQGGLQRFLEGLGGLQNMQGGAPTTLGAGLVQGFAGGLGRAGSRIQAERAKFEAQQSARAAANDLLNRKTTQDYQTERRQALATNAKERGAAGERVATEQRAAKQKQADYERDNPIVDAQLVTQFPQLGRLQGQRISRTTLDRMGAEPTNAQKAATAAAEAQAKANATPDESLLSDNAIKKLVELRLAGGPDPSFGMGKAGVKNKTRYFNALGEAPGTGGDIAANIGQAKAERENLANLTKIHGAASAFEETALKNLGILEPTLNALPDLGAKFLNTPLRAAARQFGSKELAAFDTARQIVVPEFTRLLNSPSAAGVISDSARHEMQVIIDPNATVGQIRTAIKILKQDAANRTQSYEDALVASQKVLSKIGAPPDSAQSRVKHKMSLAEHFGGP